MTISHLFGDGLISSFWIEYVCAELQEFRRFSPVLESILSEVGSLYSSNIEIIGFFSIFSQFWGTFVRKFTDKSFARKLISLIYLNNLSYSCLGWIPGFFELLTSVSWSRIRQAQIVELQKSFLIIPNSNLFHGNWKSKI